MTELRTKYKSRHKCVMASKRMVSLEQIRWRNFRRNADRFGAHNQNKIENQEP